MLPVSLNTDDLTPQFQEEMSKMFVQFMASLANLLENIDEEIAHVQSSDLGESLIDRMVRDIRANAYERFERLVIDHFMST